jgi:hypothetical protein
MEFFCGYFSSAFLTMELVDAFGASQEKLWSHAFGVLQGMSYGSAVGEVGSYDY